MSVQFYPFCEGCGQELTSTELPFVCKPCLHDKAEPPTSKFEGFIPLESSTLPLNLPSKMSLPITTQQIKDHRAARKASGMAGCITGRPEPEISFYGYSDVQSWRPSDPMKPHCFCFDCRDLWDSDATIDLQLLENGHTAALWTYGDLLPSDFVHPKHAVAMAEPAVPLLRRSEGGGVPLPPRVSTSLPRCESFGEVPMSLPAPRHRDVMNETKEQRLKNDLAELKGQIQSELVVVMDSRRSLAFHDDAHDRIEAFRKIDAKEKELWAKLDAVDLLLKC